MASIRVRSAAPAERGSLSQPDSQFYDQPRLVTHIDDGAIAALSKFYADQPVFNMPDPAILDIASSWISHYPAGWEPGAGRVIALGMSEPELKENKQANEILVRGVARKQCRE
jgi:hypothetical protein